MRTVHRVIVSAVIVSRDNKILFGMQESGGVYPGCWHFPGGGVEENETQPQALQREVLEEAGIDITPFELVLIDDQGTGEGEKVFKSTGEKVFAKMQFNVYRIDIDKNARHIKTRPGDDMATLRWIDISELANYKTTLAPPSIELFKRLGYLA